MAKNNFTWQLFEICQKNTELSLPEFKIKIQKDSNPQIFDCTCSVEYKGEVIQVSAKSGKKQHSKHGAANLMLKKLDRIGIVQNKPQIVKSLNKLSDEEIELTDNLNMMLIEICTVYPEWSMPRYNYNVEDHLYSSTVICTCSIFTPKHNFISLATASNKFKAMQLSSKDMLDKLLMNFAVLKEYNQVIHLGFDDLYMIELENICMKKRLKMPKYKIYKWNDSSSPIYTGVCEIELKNLIIESFSMSGEEFKAIKLCAAQNLIKLNAIM